MQDKLLLLHEFLNEIPNITNKDDMKRISESCLEKLAVTPDDVMYKLWEDACRLGGEILFFIANGADAVRTKKLAALSEEEKAMLSEVEKAIDENRFGYHFQPIVNTSDGSIYSYEALMRPQSDKGLKPYHVIKYAELTGRLNDIERETFLNVLGKIDSEKQTFGDRKVFINSIPKTKLGHEDFRQVNDLLMKHSDTVIVELTENAELDEGELKNLQERYRNMDVKIAIDDYGTGYSNVQNLLRYNPNYVKIDRMLLTEIQNNPKKKHFVREIIEFCHDNGILALAEGVETSEELRTVILLGADLIQGFYTARPSAEVVDSIPYEIRQEIKMYQQERQDGRDQQIYAAESSERVQLDKLVKEDYRCILVGKESEDGEVTVVGTPTLDTEIHIEVARNYKGRIVLENVCLSNVKNRPCIDIGESCDVTLVMIGENKLDKSGIRVPENARLAFEGDGMLSIKVDALEYFGIGNDMSSAHGELVFKQAGLISISARGKNGVCVGSGVGGKITIGKGKISLNVSGNTAVGIGAFSGASKIDISGCAVDANLSLMNAVAIGSMNGSVNVNIYKSSIKLNLSGKDLVAIGTIGGDNATVVINDALSMVNIGGYRCTGIGSLDNNTDIKIENAVFRASVGGEKTLPFGGVDGEIKAVLLNSDVSVDLKTAVEVNKYLTADKIRVADGKTTIIVNGQEVGLQINQ